MPSLATLRRRLDGATTAILQAVVACESEAAPDDESSSEDVAAVRECVQMLRQAHTLLRSCSERAGRASGATPRAGARTVPSLAPPPLTPLALGKAPAADGLDKELQEERELAARRALFALGAADDEESIDWGDFQAASASNSDDDGDDGCGWDGGAEDEAAAARALDAFGGFDEGMEDAADVAPRSWDQMDGFVPPGTPGFNAFAQEQMRAAGVPSNPRVLAADELKPATWVAQQTKPKLQPYQETVAFLCRPQSLPSHRMLVVHRTGAGKTATMIQVCDNFFLDRRPKILLFPTNAVCESFYRELRSSKLPNRYADYLERGGFADARRGLELPGVLRNGCVPDDFLRHPSLPSAPLRAFSYTQAGGAASCGQRPNAVFKCPDGYAGGYPERVPPQGGYDDIRCGYNPFSNKIILMDEVHNLVRPSADILRNERRMLMLQRLRQLLRTAENSTIIGLTGTPLCDVPAEAAALRVLLKGRHHQKLGDEGFVSYYMATPNLSWPSTGLPLAFHWPSTGLPLAFH